MAYFICNISAKIVKIGLYVSNLAYGKPNVLTFFSEGGGTVYMYGCQLVPYYVK